VLLCLGALGSLIWYTAIDSTSQLWVLVVMAGAALGIELTFRPVTERRIALPKI
jgi:hypothetical protein